MPVMLGTNVHPDLIKANRKSGGNRSRDLDGRHANIWWKGTSRQRSGKGAIRKRFPLENPRWEETKLTIMYLYHENIS